MIPFVKKISLITFFVQIAFIFILTSGSSNGGTDMMISYYKYIMFTVCSFTFWITNGNLILINKYVKQIGFSDLLCTEAKVSSNSNTGTVFRCAKYCALTSSCVSFFYNQNGPCQLHNISLYNTSLCIGHLDTSYYVRKGKNLWRPSVISFCSVWLGFLNNKKSWN